MCGITGILHFDKDRFINQSRLKKMTDSLIHRGPDGEGFYINKNIGLGHRRLSIIDLNTGDQPMYNDNKDIIASNTNEDLNLIYSRIQEIRESKIDLELLKKILDKLSTDYPNDWLASLEIYELAHNEDIPWVHNLRKKIESKSLDPTDLGTAIQKSLLLI